MPAGPPPATRQVVLSDVAGTRRSWHTGPGSRATQGITVRPVNGFLSWWDGIELWLSGLAFVLQALVVMPIVLVLAYLTAAVLDRLLGKGIQLMRRARLADEALG
jgi:hypothetical protein